MRNSPEAGLDFIVDKLTNSIENVVTGDNFTTEVSVLTKNDIKLVTKKNGWIFNWREELHKPEHTDPSTGRIIRLNF